PPPTPRSSPHSCPPTAHQPQLHPFPTRRSSDLEDHGERPERRAKAPGHRGRQLPRQGLEPAQGFLLHLVHDAGSGGLAPLSSFIDRKSTRLNSSHVSTSYAVFCLKKKSKISRSD